MIAGTMSKLDDFHEAVAMGDRKAVQAMLAKDPKLAKAADDGGFTALHMAAGQEDAELVELLIRAGADLSARTEDGMTPLHIAQYASAIEVLVRHGADLNARAMDGWTPLHVQAQEGIDTGALETMEALLKAGSDPNLKDDDGQTPMDFAREREEAEKVRLLSSFGAKG